MLQDSMVVSGSSNLPLAQKISLTLDIPLAEVEISKFACSETRIRVVTEVKDKNVILIQSLSDPTNDSLVELILLCDAVYRMKPKKIICVIPWLGYSPQDKVFRQGEPLSSEVIIRILENVGIHEFVVCDIHSPLVIEKFIKDVLHIQAMPIFSKLLRDVIKKPKDWVVAILDKGNIPRSELFAKDLGLALVRFDKSRDRHSGLVTFHKLDGNVKGKNVLVYDDYISTGQTLFDSAKYIKAQGARSYTCCVTHIAVSKTVEKIQDSLIDCFITTNTIDFKIQSGSKKILTLDISGIFSDTIKNKLQFSHKKR